MLEAVTEVVPLDYSNLIEQGIRDAKGPREALAMLTPEDILDLGRMLADREARIGDLFSVVVSPVNDIGTAIKKGDYSRVNEKVNGISLVEAIGSKRLYFLPISEDVAYGEEEAYANKHGLTLCKESPNYLFGAMALLTEARIPKMLDGNDFVSIENGFSYFQDQCGYPCAVRVRRREGVRELDTICLKGCLKASDKWILITEKRR